jgi:transcription antitermination factor NusG
LTQAATTERTRVAWYAVKTRARHERTTAQTLAQRGVRCFLPVWHQRRRWTDRWKTIEQPLFPTYLFVEIHSLERPLVLRSRGVVDVVTTPVVRSELEPLLALASAGAVLSPHRYLRVGQRARVHSGPFRGIEGFLVERRDAARLVLSVTLFKQSVALTIEAGDVEPA